MFTGIVEGVGTVNKISKITKKVKINAHTKKHIILLKIKSLIAKKNHRALKFPFFLLKPLS